jgi:TetR/AcrR family transcriptional repressor of uid operon
LEKGKLQVLDDIMSKIDQKRDSRKTLILDAAIACFVEKGIHQTGVRDIAKQAGISLGNLYNHFSGKDALILEIASLEGQGLGAFIQQLQSDRPIKEILTEFIDTYLNYSCEIENTVLTVEILAEGLRNKHIAKQFDTNRTTLVTALITLLSNGKKDRQFKADLNTQEIALLILDVIEGVSMRFGLEGKPPSSNARKSLHQMIENSVYR